MQLNLEQPLKSPFFENYFCLIPGTNSCFVCISKNASSFLKKVAFYNKKNIWPDFSSNQILLDKIGYSPEKSDYLIPVKNINLFKESSDKEILKFAVWRDPVDRIVSTYKLFLLEKEARYYFYYLGLYEDNSIERFLEFVEFELKKKNPLFQDEHIRKQVDYYKPEDVDHVVHIKDLMRFLDEINIPYVKERTNRTTKDFFLCQDIINKLKELYKEDYDIEITYK